MRLSLTNKLKSLFLACTSIPLCIYLLHVISCTSILFRNFIPFYDIKKKKVYNNRQFSWSFPFRIVCVWKLTTESNRKVGRTPNATQSNIEIKHNTTNQIEQELLWHRTHLEKKLLMTSFLLQDLTFISSIRCDIHKYEWLTGCVWVRTCVS